MQFGKNVLLNSASRVSHGVFKKREGNGLLAGHMPRSRYIFSWSTFLSMKMLRR